MARSQTEAAGYRVFADILSLEAGDRWRGVVTSTLQTSSVKMLLCCSNETLAAPGVLEEIDIAIDLSKELEARASSFAPCPSL